jgi:hypothetical protein
VDSRSEARVLAAALIDAVHIFSMNTGLPNDGGVFYTSIMGIKLPGSDQTKDGEQRQYQPHDKEMN